MGIRLLSWWLVVILALGGTASAQEDGDAPIIRDVLFEIGDVFPEGDAGEGSFIERAANRWHQETRESVVRRTILFAPGDRLDLDLIAASKRELRDLGFLSSVEIEVEPVDAMTVDIVVKTRDTWSLIPGWAIEGGGGLVTTSLSLVERNLLGTGTGIGLEYEYANDIGGTWIGSFRDRQIFDSHWEGAMSGRKGPLIEELDVGVWLPLYSPDSVWSYGASASHSDEQIRLFRDGEEESRIGERRTFTRAFMRRAYWKRFRKTSVTFDLKYESLDYRKLGDLTTTPLPNNQENIFPGIELTKEHVSFVEESFIRELGPTEDIRMGHVYGAGVAYGIPINDGTRLLEIDTWIHQKLKFDGEQFLYLYADFSTQTELNTILSLAAQYYKRLAWQTLSLNVDFDLGVGLDSSQQFLLGGDNGLRGFRARAFNGDRRFLMNLESRIFTGYSPVGATVGGVVFFDLGDAWEREEPLAFDDMNYSAGVGLRLGFNSVADRPILRVDFGVPLSESGYAFTFGLGQQF